MAASRLREPAGPSAWQAQLLAAAAAALMGTLDRDSSDNVFIPLGAWLIVVGTCALAHWSRRPGVTQRWHLPFIALAAAFADLFYDPRTVVTSGDAPAAYADLVTVIDELSGSVYAPFLGSRLGEHRLVPGAHWVALEDIERGPRRGPTEHLRALALLGPALRPAGNAYVLTNVPLERHRPPVRDLAAVYLLDRDFGERFAALRAVPGRFDLGYPRYLYRFAGSGPRASP